MSERKQRGSGARVVAAPEVCVSEKKRCYRRRGRGRAVSRAQRVERRGKGRECVRRRAARRGERRADVRGRFKQRELLRGVGGGGTGARKGEGGVGERRGAAYDKMGGEPAGKS